MSPSSQPAAALSTSKAWRIADSGYGCFQAGTMPVAVMMSMVNEAASIVVAHIPIPADLRATIAQRNPLS